MADKPKSVAEERIERGRERLQSLAPMRDEAWEFYRGNHYAYIDDKGTLSQKAVYTGPRGKPNWLARQSRNLIFDVVLHEVSAATQRIPSFQVLPATTDPEDVTAAHLAQKVAIYGYYQWQLRSVARDAVLHAVVAGESFAWPYFDTSIGPFIGDEEGQVGLGDVRVKIYGANECYWEPGMRFENSPWHVVEQARSLDAVMKDPSYTGPKKLTPDANTRSLANKGRQTSDKAKLILVSEYLELPTPNNPKGRWLCFANGKQIREERPYPGTGPNPCIHKLSYATDPDADRDLGLVRQLIDAQRTFEDCNNKAVEWKNIALMPQFAVTPGAMAKQRRTPEPGKIYQVYQPNENLKILDTPQVPSELFEMMDRAERDIARIAAQNDIPSQVESGRAIEALIEKDGNRRQAFVADLAEWWSCVMQDCLHEVQTGYSEERTLQIRGRVGWEPIPDFKGSQLQTPVDVRVSPDSIEPRTKAAIEQKVMNFAQAFPGVFPPEEIMSAINNGNAEALLDTYELAKARANSTIQKIRDGSFLDMGMRPVLSSEQHMEPVYDEITGEMIMIAPGQPMMRPAMEVPEWMPRPFDKIPVLKGEMEKWMMTSDFDDLPPEGKDAANMYYQALLDLEQQQAMREAMQQQQMAEGLGMANAAKPQGPSPMPSLPSQDSPDTSQ